jgi:hypothetical protein
LNQICPCKFVPCPVELSVVMVKHVKVSLEPSL